MQSNSYDTFMLATKSESMKHVYFAKLTYRYQIPYPIQILGRYSQIRIQDVSEINSIPKKDPICLGHPTDTLGDTLKPYYHLFTSYRSPPLAPSHRHQHRCRQLPMPHTWQTCSLDVARHRSAELARCTCHYHFHLHPATSHSLPMPLPSMELCTAVTSTRQLPFPT